MSAFWPLVLRARACAVAAEARTIEPAPWARVPRRSFKNCRRWEGAMLVVLSAEGRIRVGII
jgi:hypothetical protein